MMSSTRAPVWYSGHSTEVAVHSPVKACTCVCVYVCVCVCVCVCVKGYMCISICVFSPFLYICVAASLTLVLFLVPFQDLPITAC